MVVRGNTWNTKCPIFLGNFTPKTATIASKIGHLAFQAHIYYGDLTWWIYMPKKHGKTRLGVVEETTISDSCQVVEPCWTIQFNKLYMLSSQIWETHHWSNIWGVKMTNIDQNHQAPRFEPPLIPQQSNWVTISPTIIYQNPPLPQQKCHDMLEGLFS